MSPLGTHPTLTGSWPCPHQGCLPFPPELLPVPRSSICFKKEWKTRVICPTWLPAAEISVGFSAAPTPLLPWVKSKSPLQPTSRPPAPTPPSAPAGQDLLGHSTIAHLASMGSRRKLLANEGVESPDTLQGHSAAALCPWSEVESGGWCPTSWQPLHPDQDMLCPSSCQGDLCPEPIWPSPEMRT